MIGQHETNDAGTFDLGVYFFRLWVRRWLLVASILSIGCTFAIYSFLATPIFRVSTVFVSAAQEKSRASSSMGALAQLGGLASLAGVSIGGGDLETEEALAVLRSRQFVETFIIEGHLMPVLFFEKWDSAKNTWRTPNGAEPSMGLAYRMFSKKMMSIERDKKTGLININIDWQDRGQAAAWANEIVERINAEMRGRAIANATASIKYLQTELEETSDIGTREAINRLIEAQIKQRMLANVSKEFAFRVVDKAIMPEPFERIWPKRALLVIVGCFLGFVFGLGVVLVADREHFF